MGTTIFALLGIYITFIVLAFYKDNNILKELIKAQASLGGLYVNLIAVVGVAYSKFAKEMFVHRNVYWLSLAAFIVVISIFAQAKGSLDNTIEDFLQPMYISYILQIILAGIIWMLASQQEYKVQIKYKKKT
ncbi:hypothetical protein E5358_12460 [Palleniella muris]|uniref:Uncharacterized protein n=1 Tax=Palleniella muris TaxID=3038145 RepID=A0AC61QMF4_9BACT|nr:hypothetical protein [Palleniella muris]TGX80578.1 hypothetical protein E5358_12460 [Palleniella muris]